MTLREQAKRSVTLRLLARWLRTRTYAYPRWDALVARDRGLWDEARARAHGGPRILIATAVGGHPYAVTLESLLAVALTLRGAEVHFLLCDGVLPGCELTETTWFPDHARFVRSGPQGSLCRVCYAPARRAYAPLGLPVHRFSELVPPDERRRIDSLAMALSPAEMEKLEQDGIGVGEHARAGALRFFARGTLDGEPHAPGVLRRYLRGALLAAAGARRLLRGGGWRCAVAQHGIYVPQGVLGEVARQEGVRVVNWNVAYRKRRFIFSHGDTYHRTMTSEPTATWERLDLTAERERELMEYLRSRWYGTRDWIWFHERPLADPGEIERRLGIDFTRPCVGMLTNVMWDAQIHYPANAFPGMLDWVVQTIAYFARRPELQLVIRVHPAEIRGTLPSRQPLVEEIRKAFPVVPPNVFVIPPEANISTYALMLRCDSVVIFGTKTGVELAAEGLPVLVAGEAWIRGKGISMDASSAEDYYRLLDRLPLGKRLDDETVRRARAYAYHFFFRRMIPLEFTEPTGGWLPFRLAMRRLTECRPDRSRGLDVICDGVVHGSDFVYPAETEPVTWE